MLGLSLPVWILLGWALVIGVLAMFICMADLGGPRDPRNTRKPAPAPVERDTTEERAA